MKRVFASLRPSVPLFFCGLILSPFQANAERISTSAGDYEVSTEIGMFDDPAFASTLFDQVWWGDSALAHEFAALIGDSLGVLDGEFGDIGPIFAYTTEIPPVGEFFGWDVGGAAWCGPGTEAFCTETDTFYNTGDVDGFYAVAVPVSIEGLLSDLSELIFGINLQAGISNSLDAKLGAVLMALDDTNANNDAAALNSMYAFCNNVEAQRAGKLTDEQADELVSAANSIIQFIDELAPLCE